MTEKKQDPSGGYALIIQLNTPIEAHGESISELKLRAPTAADIIAVGNPISLDISTDPPRAEPNDKRMAAMMARLADIPPSAIGQIGPNDFTGAIIKMLPFFVPRL